MSVAFGGGFLPNGSVGVMASATVLAPRLWPVEVYGGFWAAQDVGAGRGAAIHFTSAFGGLGLCPLRTHGGRLAFQLCAAGQVGVVDSEPMGFVTDHGGSLPTLHAVADAHLAFFVSTGVAVRAGASLGAALLRSQFVFDNVNGRQMLFDPPFLAAMADLGLTVAVP